MDSVVANWPTAIVCLYAAVALYMRLMSGAGYSLALFVCVSCVLTLGVDYAFFDVTDAAQWHTIAIIKVGLASAVAGYIAVNHCSAWWVLILASLCLDFAGNSALLIAAIYDSELWFATIYPKICIITALLEAIAANGDDRLADYRDVRNGKFSGAYRLHSAHNNHDQV